MRFACPWIFLTLTSYISLSQILVLFYFIQACSFFEFWFYSFHAVTVLFLCFSQTVFERNCQSDDCAADLKLQGKLLLSRWVSELLFFLFLSYTWVCRSFYVRWHWKIKIRTQTFYIRTRRMMTVISSLVQKGLKNLNSCGSELCAHTWHDTFTFPITIEKNWAKKYSSAERGRESKDACLNQVSIWTM